MPDPATALVAWLTTPGIGEELPDLEDLAHRPGWTKRPQCRGEDPALFFPSVGANAAKARAICSLCPVRPECLAYALADPESAGVWGGISERERRKLRSVA